MCYFLGSQGICAMLMPKTTSCQYGLLVATVAVILFSSGCASRHRADRGALFGGLTGAGIGALVGNASGNTGAGAAIGAGVGALTGAVVGSELDTIEAQNRAEIEARMGRSLAVGSVTMGDVVSMSQAGVDDRLIANHVRTNGYAGALTANDLIALQQQGVGSDVVQAMQQAPQAAVGPAGPVPVVVEEYHYPPPYWGHYGHPPHYSHHGHGRHHSPNLSWGVSVHH
jgi:hypothetical protein